METMTADTIEGMNFERNNNTESGDGEKTEHKIYIEDAEEAGSTLHFGTAGFRRIIRAAGTHQQGQRGEV